MIKWVKHQLTEQQAEAFITSGIRRQWTPEQEVRYQLFQNRFIVDIEYYLKCLGIVYQREIHLNHIFVNEQWTELIFYYLKTHKPQTIRALTELLGEKTRLNCYFYGKRIYIQRITNNHWPGDWIYATSHCLPVFACLAV